MKDDQILAELIRAGDKHSFEYLFKQYFTPLCRFALVYVKQEIIAEELVYDLFSAIWEKRGQLHIEQNLKVYLFQAVRNRAKNYLRDHRESADVEAYDFINLADDPDTRLEVEELERLISEAISSLPDRCKEVFVKSRVENKKNIEIAQELGISLKGVEASITRALRHIRLYLDESYSYCLAFVVSIKIFFDFFSF